MKIGMVIIGVIVVVNLISTGAMWNSRSSDSVKVNNRLIELQRAEETFGEKLLETAGRAQDLTADYNALLAENNALVEENNGLVAEMTRVAAENNDLVRENSELYQALTEALSK